MKKAVYGQLGAKSRFWGENGKIGALSTTLGGFRENVGDFSKNVGDFRRIMP